MPNLCRLLFLLLNPVLDTCLYCDRTGVNRFSSTNPLTTLNFIPTDIVEWISLYNNIRNSAQTQFFLFFVSTISFSWSQSVHYMVVLLYTSALGHDLVTYQPVRTCYN